MIITKTDIIGKIRKAIDDIAPSGVNDSFADNTDDELWQAVFHAVQELSLELPINLLDISLESLTGSYNSSRGCSIAALPNDYLRFVALQINACVGPLYELIEPGSEEEKMQRSVWTRGTASKPKAMIDHDNQQKKAIVWWPGGETHNTANVGYIADPVIVNTATTDVPTVPAITSALRDEAERLAIYRAAAIFFEGKKEAEIAEKFRNLSTTI